MIQDHQLSPDISKELYPLGEHIFKEGDLGTHFYIVHSGKVEIFSQDKNGKKIHYSFVEKGEAFGEFALLDKKPRSASARAVSDTVLFRVSEKGYEQLLSEIPDWAVNMMRSFIARLKLMNEQLKDKQFLKQSGR